MQDFIEFSSYLADEAGQIICQYFRQSFDVEQKGDESPVTIADRRVEERLRHIIEERRPEDGIIGEEFGIKEAKNQYTWVLDPIDGTKSFVIGRPTFGTLIALCENGVPILGIIDQPINKERWIGAKGIPTTFNGDKIKTVKCENIKSARMACTSPSQLPTLWQKLEQNGKMFAWGGDCYSYGLLAMGGLDVVIETQLGIHDFAALPPIVEGAGGCMCDWKGDSLTIGTGNEASVIAVGDVSLKEKILEAV